MQWQRLGPGGGGAMYIPTVQPTDPRTAIVTCDMTGTYLTRDGGESWRQINFTGMVRAFAFDPFDEGKMYAGSSALYRSIDGAKRWQLLYPRPEDVVGVETFGDHASHAFLTKNGMATGYVDGLLIHPGASGVIWAGLNASRLRDYYERGTLSIVVSLDDGKTWSEPIGIEGKKFVRFCPIDGGGMYVITDAQIIEMKVSDGGCSTRVLRQTGSEYIDASFGRDPVSGQWIYYVTERPSVADSNAHRSCAYRFAKPEGEWTMLCAESLFSDHAEGQLFVFAHVAVCANDAGRVYLSLSEPMSKEERVPGKESFFGLFASENFGDDFHWALRIGDSQAENRTQGWVERDFGTGWGGAPFGLGVSPSDPDICYATDWGTCYKTTDGGRSFEQLYTNVSDDGSVCSRGLDITLVYHLGFDPHEAGHLAIACTDIGFFHSYDDGRTWTHAMAGIPDAISNSCYCMAFDPDIRGKGWSCWTNCHDLPRPKMFINGQFRKRRGAVFCSTDAFHSWTCTSGGLPDGIAPTCLIIDPQSPAGSRTLYITAMGDGVYKSVDDGKTWALCNRGIGENKNAWKLFLADSGALYLLVARGLEDGRETDGALYKSTDGANSWEAIALPEGANAPNYLAIDPKDEGCLYLACWPRVVDGDEGHGGLYQSADGGRHWMLLSDAASHVYGVAISPYDERHIVWSNFENQLWQSFDGGKTAVQIEGYDFKWAHQPIFHPTDPKRLYLATFGSGLWFSTL